MQMYNRMIFYIREGNYRRSCKTQCWCKYPYFLCIPPICMNHIRHIHLSVNNCLSTSEDKSCTVLQYFTIVTMLCWFKLWFRDLSCLQMKDRDIRILCLPNSHHIVSYKHVGAWRSLRICFGISKEIFRLEEL
jgi:hypothetical protein